jgi:glucose-6-phosphate 1-dehydrogenase
MANALTILIFGATGDLTARKLVPALYHLFAKGRLDPQARIVGVARTRLRDEQFRERLEPSVREESPDAWDAARWRAFADRLFYLPGDAAAAGGLEGLQAWLQKQEGPGGGRRLYYLAVAPDLYPGIATRLGEVGMSREPDDEHWRRLVIEKPFGRDLATAKALNRVLHAHFDEDQLYRIDHYLGKETVQNILAFRFANTIFEPLWSGNYIDHVQITVAEDGRVGSRGSYYDRSGVLRDMFQNHLLQLLALVAMEAPARYAAGPLRAEKLKVLDAIPIFTPEEAAERVCTGQYVGYRSEPGVAANSRTPTFAAVRLNIDNWRWKNVPFYLRSGKVLPARRSEVIIQFHCPPHLMFPLPPGQTLQCNRLALCIQPDEGIHLNFQTKVPDEHMALRPSDLEFHYKSAYPGVAIPEAYQRLLQDAILGDASLFMSSAEIERAWAVVDPLIAATERPGAPAPSEYAPGSDGPGCADQFLARDGRKWISLCGHHGEKPSPS